MTAPPTTAIINRPDISLDLEGILSMAIENTKGNRLPAPKPTMKIPTIATNSVGDHKITNVPKMAKRVVVTRKNIGFKKDVSA